MKTMQCDPLVADRCNARKAAIDNTVVASLAATGFGLTALCIGEKRGYISRSDAKARVPLSVMPLTAAHMACSRTPK